MALGVTKIDCPRFFPVTSEQVAGQRLQEDRDTEDNCSTYWHLGSADGRVSARVIVVVGRAGAVYCNGDGEQLDHNVNDSRAAAQSYGVGLVLSNHEADDSGVSFR